MIFALGDRHACISLFISLKNRGREMDDSVTNQSESESQDTPQKTDASQGDKVAIEQRVEMEPPHPSADEPMDTPAPKRPEEEAPDQDALL